MVQQEGISVKSPQFCFNFELANLAAGQTDTVIPVSANGDEYTMPYDGFVYAMAVALNDAVTAEDVDFQVTINGTVDTDLAVQLDTTNTQYHYGNVPEGEVPFSAGDRLGAAYDSHASFTPTTADVVVTLYVCFYNVEF